MKNFIVILLLFSNLFYSQNKRFFYSYDYLKDTTNINSWTKLNTILDVGKDGSRYMDYDFFRSDSIKTVELQKNIRFNKLWGKVMKRVVVKEYPEYKIFSFETTTKNIFKVKDSRKIVWDIVKETEKIGAFETQKATAVIFGRKWTAWFTPEIPIYDGPYKFYGLPGLIVKLEDDSKTHKFLLIGIQPLSNFNIKKSLYGDTKPLEIDEIKFKKIYIADRNITRVGETDTEAKNITYYNSENQKISHDEFFRNISRNRAQWLKTNNNHIELELLKK